MAFSSGPRVPGTPKPPPKRVQRRLTEPENRIKRWIARTRGVIKEVAEEIGGTSEMNVHRVAYGVHHSREGKIEAALTKRGWPGGKA
jgi:hypothetical protein